MTISQDKLRRLFDYDGRALIWRERPSSDFKAERDRNAWNTKYAGKTTGCVKSNGYALVRVGYRLYYTHRLIFLREHGWLPKEIDHVNHVRDDNRLSNLRPADHSINARNHTLHDNNTSGRVGVSQCKNRNKWRAYITINGRQTNLGHFDDFGAACEARSAAEKAHGFHQNHGEQLT